MNQAASQPEHTVAVYDTHEQAEAAIRLLAKSGHDMKRLSIVGQEYSTEERPIGFINAGDRIFTWGERGAFWGSIFGLFMGSALLFVPGIGYVMFAGWLVSALEGALLGGGLGAIGGALASIGIPENTVVKYEAALKEGRFLVVVHGSEDEVQRARAELQNSGATSIDSYSSGQA